MFVAFTADLDPLQSARTPESGSSSTPQYSATATDPPLPSCDACDSPHIALCGYDLPLPMAFVMLCFAGARHRCPRRNRGSQGTFAPCALSTVKPVHRHRSKVILSRILLQMLCIALCPMLPGCLTPLLFTELPVPPELQLHVAQDDLGLQKTILWQGETVGKVSDLKVAELDLSPGKEIAIAGRDGAVILTRDLTAVSSVAFPNDGLSDGDRQWIVPGRANSRPEYFSVNFDGWQVLRTAEGRLRWEVNTDDEVAREGPAIGSGDPEGRFGDLDGDGNPEFIAPREGVVEILDQDGHSLWRTDSPDAFYTLIADADGDADLDVIALTPEDQLTAYDATGEKIATRILSKLDVWPWPVRFPTSDGPIHLLLNYYYDPAEIVDLEGTTVFAFEDVLLPDYPNKGSSIRFAADRGPYFAVVGEIHWQGGYFVGFQEVRTELQIFDATGTRVYSEVLEEGDLGLAVLQDESTGTERLLIGTTNKVYSYALQPQE